MRYVARVVVIFSEGSSYPNTVDAWDTIVLLEAGGARSAVQKAISMSRSAFEHGANLKRLGYATKPVLYVVSSVSRKHALPSADKSDCGCSIVITDMMSLTEREVQQLRSRRKISVPLHALYVVQR